MSQDKNDPVNKVVRKAHKMAVDKAFVPSSIKQASPTPALPDSEGEDFKEALLAEIKKRYPDQVDEINFDDIDMVYSIVKSREAAQTARIAELELDLHYANNAIRLGDLRQKMKEEALEAELSRLKALLSEKEWISVKERLPEEGVAVLLFITYNETVIIGANTPVNHRQFEDSFGEKYTTEEVTHWMPLPSPPSNQS